MLVVDHLVGDGMSMELVRRDLEDVLAGIVREKAASLAEFVRYEEEYLESPASVSDIEFWSQMWADFGDDRISVSDLPFYIKSESGTVAAKHLLLDADWTRRFDGLAKVLRVTPHCLFLSAFLVVLSACLKRTRVAIFTHFANRRAGPFLETVAMMQTTHLVGFEIDPNLSFEHLARYVRGRLMDAMAHQGTALPQVFSKLGWRPLQYCARPLAEFGYDESVPREVRLPDGRVILSERVELGNPGLSRFSSFGLYTRHLGDQTAATLEYQRGQLEAAGAENALGDISSVLALASDSPSTSVSELMSKASDRYRAFPAHRTLYSYSFCGSTRIPSALPTMMPEVWTNGQ